MTDTVTFDTVKKIIHSSEYIAVVECKADYNLYNVAYIKATVKYRKLFSGKIGADDRCALIMLCEHKKHGYQFLVVTAHLSYNFDHQLNNWLELKGKISEVIIGNALGNIDVYLLGDFNTYRYDPKYNDDLVDSKMDYYSSIKKYEKDQSAIKIDMFRTYLEITKEYIDTYDLYNRQHDSKIDVPSATTIYNGKIDFIMVNKDNFSKTILGLYQIFTNYSDHTPLVCDVLL